MKATNIAIVGLGLIGGSLAKALKRADARLRIAAADLDASALDSALKQGTIDRAGGLDEICAAAEIIVIAVPPPAGPKVLGEIARRAAVDAVVTDVASVKSHLLETLAALPEAFRRGVVPGHPLAGSEYSGFAASRAELFHERNVVLTPTTDTSAAAMATVLDLWRAVGAGVFAMSAARHDRILALTSHLPHLLAFAAADLLPRREPASDVNHYAASGFADFTRLAAGDPRLWGDIFSLNAANLGAALDVLLEDLTRLRNALAADDHSALLGRLRRAGRARRSFAQTHAWVADSRAGPAIGFRVRPGGVIRGRLRVPGDKSISHRAAILGALAEGTTRISGFLEGADSLNTLAALRELGVLMAGPENGRLTVYGLGGESLQAPRKPLYMGNSGTAMRLLAGVLAGQNFAAELRGDESLSKRPMRRIATPLAAMGAAIDTQAEGCPPLRIRAGSLRGIDHVMPVASAQVKSCLLLAGLRAEGVTVVREPGPCRDHTERMLTGFGAVLEPGLPPGAVGIRGGQRLMATDVEVPGDISSAAFFLVAAAIAPGSELTLERVGVNPTRTGVIDILRRMGADIRLRNTGETGGEPVADIEIRHRPLRGIDIGASEVALAIDEFPALLVAAACAEGETRIRGAAELRVKESDRIEAMARGLGVLGIEHETYPDGIRVMGGEPAGGVIDSCGDHRIAMAFAIAAPRCRGELRIRDCANVATSFPGFAAAAHGVGIDIAETESKS